MLELLRSNLGGWVAKIFIGLLVASFALWGIADYATSSGSNVAIEAGETKVGTDEFRFAFDRQVLLTSQQFGRRLTNEEARQFGVEDQVIGQLVTGAVLEEQAEQMGLGVSDDNIASTISSDQAFQDASGNFNRRIFVQTLQNAGLTPNDFIDLQKAVAVRQQLVDGAVMEARPPAVFLDALKEHQSEARTVSYITIPSSLVGEVADPSTTELEEYFEANKARYRAPEYRTVKYLTATAQDLAKLDEITEETAREEYERNIGLYTQEEVRQIEQIVLTSDEMRQQVETVLAEGGDFDAVVEALELTPGQQIIGRFTRAQYPDQNLVDTAFDVESGGTSDIVAGAFGDVVLRPTVTVAETVEPFEAVRDSIREELAVGDAIDALVEALDRVEDARASGRTLEEAAEAEGLEVQFATLDSGGQNEAGELVADIVDANELLSDVFETEVGVETDPIRLEGSNSNPGGEGYLWYEITEIEEARDRTLDEVTERVIADWKEEETSNLVQATADGLLKRARNGTDFATLADPLGLEVQQLPVVRRTSTDSGLPDQALSSVFEGKPGSVALASGAQAGEVILLKSDKAAEDVADVELPAELTDRVNSTVADDLFAQLVTRLQSDLAPTVNRSAINSTFQSSAAGHQGL
jgi:peptidyl-prolyl cis-trans isomerase D